MGDGYAILVWDGWGCGLVRINPRLITEGIDMYGYPKNWFGCDYKMTDAEILKKHSLDNCEYYQILR